MAKHKTIRSRRKQQQGFIRLIKVIAAVLYWLASFALIIIEICEHLKG